MTADELINAWAASRLGVDPATVTAVEFIHYDERHYSELTYEPAYDAAHVQTTDGQQFVDLTGEEIGQIVREVLAAGDLCCIRPTTPVGLPRSSHPRGDSPA